MATDDLMGERMAIIETKVDSIKADISEIKEILKNINCTYAVKSEVDIRIEAIEKRLDTSSLWIRGLAISFLGTITLLALKLIFKV